MSFSSSAYAKFFFHDLDMSPYLDGVDPTASRALGEHRPIGGNPLRLTQGHMRLAISLTGVYDSDPGGPGEAETMWAAFEGAEVHPFTHLPQGDAFGAVAYCGLNDLGSLQETAGEGPVKYPVAVVGSDEFDRCVVLTPHTHKTASGEGAAHDNLLATANGGAAYLHCTDIDAGCTLAVTIEHSADGIDWEDLAAFTDLVGVRGSEQLEIAAKTAVREYVRANWTLTGGHATFIVAFGRR